MRLVRLKPRRDAFGWRNDHKREAEGVVKGRLEEALAAPDRNARLKSRRAEGLTYKALGEEFGISAARAYAICNK